MRKNQQSLYKKESGAALITVLLLTMIFSIIVLVSVNKSINQEKLAVEQVIVDKSYVSAQSGMKIANRDLSRIDLLNSGIEECLVEDNISTMIDLGNSQYTSYCFEKQGKGQFKAKSLGVFNNTGDNISSVNIEADFSMGFNNLASINIIDDGDFNINRIRHSSNDTTNIFMFGNFENTMFGSSVSSIDEDNFNNMLSNPSISQALFLGLEATPQYPASGINSMINETPALSMRDKESFDRFITSIRDDADVLLSTNNISGQSFGNENNPQITYIENDVTASTPFSGTGILVIDGDANFSSGYAFQGLVIVNGNYSNGITSFSESCRRTPPGQGGTPPGQGGTPPGQGGGGPPGQQRGRCLTSEGEARLAFISNVDFMQNINQSHICLNNTVLNAIQFYGFNSNLNICQDFDDKIAFSSLLKGALVINSSDQVDISINTVSDDECGLGVDDVGCAQDIYMFDKEALETAYLLLSDESRMIWERFYNIKTTDIIKNNL